MLFRQLFDPETSTYTYLIADLPTQAAILVDPVLEHVERDLWLLKQLGLTLHYCLETHVHADHITGAGSLRQQTGCINVVPKFAGVDCADQVLEDGDRLQLGEVEIKAIATPGHTDSHLAYLINRTHLLTGDALLIRGCGRTDFQSGDAGTLFDAVTQRLFTLPDETLVYPGHDYRGQTVSTIGEEKRWNPRLAGRSREQFQAFMSQLQLPNPQKMAEAVPANQHCGNGSLVAAEL
ncbi:MAG: MBL fold metallo-hydrolase [Synechococcales bacterium]|nr:MBL fold metallo-hydrolase [Synechococcales bacterium]